MSDATQSTPNTLTESATGSSGSNLNTGSESRGNGRSRRNRGSRGGRGGRSAAPSGTVGTGAAPVSTETQFKGRCEALSGFVYDLVNPTAAAGAFSTTTEKIAGYFGRSYSLGNYTKLEI